ncbi:MAG: methyltransferase domain-containing protein [Spirochaetaceae bacterium]|nr:MAG: methyltransferase domain-containing protein [Spirochaetaceae bacterium]
MAEKRRHVRVVHRDVVRFDAAGTTFEGVSVDISRNGIQVEVAVPQSFDQVDLIRFSLPERGAELEMPVRLARHGEESGGDGQYTLAFEFLHGADPQLRLIENYIREAHEHHLETDGLDTEARDVPRLDCEVSARCGGNLTGAVIENVSPDGLLVSAEGRTTTGAIVPLEFALPGDGREVSVRCRVVYVVNDSVGSRIRFGARFTDLSQVQRARISGFIEHTAATRSLSTVRSLITTGDDGGYWLDREQSARVLREARHAVFYVLLAGEHTIHHARRVIDVDESPESDLLLVLTGTAEAYPGQPLFLSFACAGSNYYISSSAESVEPQPEDGECRIRVVPPERIHRTDNRSAARKRVFEDTGITLYPGGEERGGAGLIGDLIDISWRGFLCELTVHHGVATGFGVGTPVTYTVDSRYGLMSHGRIRHLSTLRETANERVVQIGVETGVHRRTCHRRVVSATEWESRLSAVGTASGGTRPRCVSRRVEYRNRRGQAIAALVNQVGHGENPTVIVIPPAFGKKKETLAPLAATLCFNFARAGHPIVVIRFDGINRPGESYNQTDHPARGYEMLHYRPTQGVDDMRTTLDYVYNNPDFDPARVILITSSMSSVDARKFLLSEGKRVTAWVSLMGVAAARTTLMNVLAGTDIVANHKLNVRSGVRGMLGHLVNMDILARDLIEQKYAFLTDARFDLARIDLPVLWILGEHDHWVDPREVEDIMSVESGAPRELVQIPTGHNLRNSNDAAEAFRMITDYCAGIADAGFSAVVPPREVVLAMVAREREAVFQPLDIGEVSAYWHSYLLGNRHDSEGYDFYDKLVEFRRFITTEAALLDPAPGQVVADIGCGTGLLAREILRRLSARGGSVGAGLTEIAAFDLVPEALERAKEKCLALVAEKGNLDDVSLRFEVQNLEPNRFLPVLDFVEHLELPVHYLAGRIEGLPDSVIERWYRQGDPELGAFLRGTPGASPVSLPEEPYARELNRASRFVRGLLSVGDLQTAPPGLPDSAPAPPGTYRSDDLTFRLLSFGSSSVPEREDVPPRIYDAVAASLFISYILNPDYLLAELHRSMKPGGRILLSSMRPDSDVSKIFTDYIHRLDAGAEEKPQLAAAQAMLNEAAALFELEEDGYFRFYTGEELCALLKASGFRDVKAVTSLGEPSQAFIATGIAVTDPPQPWSRRE